MTVVTGVVTEASPDFPSRMKQRIISGNFKITMALDAAFDEMS